VAFSKSEVRCETFIGIKVLDRSTQIKEKLANDRCLLNC
jgi:hypothetical protein